MLGIADWECARDGHGGNVALRELVCQNTAGHGIGTKTDHAQHFVFSLLRVVGPSTPSSEVNSAKFHNKAALMTLQFGPPMAQSVSLPVRRTCGRASRFR